MSVAEDDRVRDAHFRQLRASLQALALSASTQPALFADLATTPDQLASDFDQAACLILADYDEELTASHERALAQLQQKLATMSRDGAEFDADLWTDAALRSSVHWDDVRQLARGVLEAFGWSVKDAAQES